MRATDLIKALAEAIRTHGDLMVLPGADSGKVRVELTVEIVNAMQGKIVVVR